MTVASARARSRFIGGSFAAGSSSSSSAACATIAARLTPRSRTSVNSFRLSAGVMTMAFGSAGAPGAGGIAVRYAPTQL